MPALLLLFIVVPLVEIYVLIEIGAVIGALSTIAACVATAIIGGALLRYQGLQTLYRAQRNLARGEVPAMEMFEGVALGIGGALLLTPGFVTDTVGFLCLLPPTRRALIRLALRRLQVRGGPGGPGGPAAGGAWSGDAIEGEYRRRK